MRGGVNPGELPGPRYPACEQASSQGAVEGPVFGQAKRQGAAWGVLASGPRVRQAYMLALAWASPAVS